MRAHINGAQFSEGSHQWDWHQEEETEHFHKLSYLLPIAHPLLKGNSRHDFQNRDVALLVTVFM